MSTQSTPDTTRASALAKAPERMRLRVYYCDTCAHQTTTPGTSWHLSSGITNMYRKRCPGRLVAVTYTAERVGS